jgi:hypothetical protein
LLALVTCPAETQVSVQMPEKPRDQTVHEGESAMFGCRVHGQPEPSLVWLHDGRPVSPSRCVVSSDSAGRCTLLIPRVTHAEAGQYTVRVSNMHGVVEAAAHLTVLGETCFY